MHSEYWYYNRLWIQKWIMKLPYINHVHDNTRNENNLDMKPCTFISWYRMNGSRLIIRWYNSETYKNFRVYVNTSDK